MFNRFHLLRRSPSGGPGPSRPTTDSFQGEPFVPTGFIPSDTFYTSLSLPPETITIDVPGQPNPVTIVASPSEVTNPNPSPTVTVRLPPSIGTTSQPSILPPPTVIVTSFLPSSTGVGATVSTSTSGSTVVGAAASTSGSSAHRADLNSGIIVGGIAATLVGLVGLIFLCLFLIRRRDKKRADEASQYAPRAFVPPAGPPNHPARGEKQTVVEPTPQGGTEEPRADVSATLAPASELAYTAIAYVNGQPSSGTLVTIQPSVISPYEPAPPYSPDRP